MQRLGILLLSLTLQACGEDATDALDRPGAGGKADTLDEERVWEVLLTQPHCDVCTSADKTVLQAGSPIAARVLQLVDSAEHSIEIAQFTWSNREIEAAVQRAAQRGVQVRIAMDAKQAQGDTVARRLADAGLAVEFVQGRDAGSFVGLQHAKFMRVDDDVLLIGSNNWSSTGVSINEENTMVLTSAEEDPLIEAFDCYFDVMFEHRIDDGPACSTEEVRFSPSSAASNMLRDEFRTAERSIDVLMHHLVFDKSIKELTKAAARGIDVRVIVNAEDRDEIDGSLWDAFFEAGGRVRFKKTNPELFQLMHHKLAVVDRRILLNGSGNWSGSAFFNNYEFYLRTTHPQAVEPFVDSFERLWSWSLSDEALEQGLTAAEQDAEANQIFFGNLHAHYAAEHEGRLLDDGSLERTQSPESGPDTDTDGGGSDRIDVSDELDGRDPARFAFEYARDEGGLDFLALSPHVTDDRPGDPPDLPNMTASGYAALLRTASEVTQESAGVFVALSSMEWSTNSTGNHVGILGSSELCKAERGAFDQLFDVFLPARSREGDQPLVMFNHPRTFSHHGALEGSWDQVFDVELTQIPKAGERRKKFNDFGLDDYEPLRSVRDQWITGEALPDPQVVRETLAAIEEASRPYARLMEVTVARGTELGSEEPQNPSLSENEEGELERFVKVHSDWDYYLRHGFALAPAANHDNHLANWGTGHTSRTAIIAPELTESALLSAIEQRSVYASEDPNLEIRFYAEGRIRSGGMGATVDDTVTVQVLLSDPDFPGRFDVTVYLGMVGADAVEPIAIHELVADQWHELQVPLARPGEHFVYLQVYEPEPDRMAWTAPVWITRLAQP